MDVDEALQLIVETVNTHKTCKAELESLEKTNQKLKKNVDECEQRYKVLEEMSGQIAAEEIAKYKTELNSFSKTLVEKNHKLQSENRLIEVELKKLKEENATIRSKMECGGEMSENESAQITLLQKQNKLLYDENKHLKERQCRINEKIDTLEKENKNLKIENKSLTEKLKNLDERLRRLEN